MNLTFKVLLNCPNTGNADEASLYALREPQRTP